MVFDTDSKDKNASMGLRLFGISLWRLLEGAVVVAALISLFVTFGRKEPIAAGNDGGSRRATGGQTKPMAPAFTDARTLVGGGQQHPPTAAPPVQAPAMTLVPAAAAATPAAKISEPAVVPAPRTVVAGPTPTPTQPSKPVALAAAIPPPAPATAPADNACPAPAIAVTPLPAGQMKVRVTSPCRRGQDIGFAYDVVELKKVMPANGNLEFAFDAFSGDTKSVDVTFADGSRRVLPVMVEDLGRVSKIAVRWRGPVNLDLHVFEHAAGAGQAGHVWARQASSSEAALREAQASGRGKGFLTLIEEGAGDRLEVYTYVHGEKDGNSSIAMAVDHETRGDLPSQATCGQGALAKVDFGLTLLSRSGELTRASGLLKPARCDQPLPAAERFDYGLMPVIALRQ